MKKYFGILFCVIMLFCFVGCNKSEKASQSSLNNSQTSSAAPSEASSSKPAASSASSSEQTANSNSKLALFKEDKVSFMLPKSFHKASESPILYVPVNYPKVADNFNVTVSPKSAAFDKITKELYTEQLKSMFPDIAITEFKNTTISKYPAIKVDYSFTYNKVSMKGTQYLVDADKMYTFTYTFSNGDLKDYANDCAASISISK